MSQVSSSFDDFFLIRDVYSDEVFRGAARDDYRMLEDRTYGQTASAQTPRISLEEGCPSNVSDVIWISSIPIVSSAFVTSLREVGATGFRTFGVLVTGRDSVSVDGYVGLAIYGRCHQLGYDFDNPNIVEIDRPARKVNHYRGKLFDKERWDGSDIFVEEIKPGPIVIGHRVADQLRRSRLSNFELQPLSECITPEWDTNVPLIKLGQRS